MPSGKQKVIIVILHALVTDLPSMRKEPNNAPTEVLNTQKYTSIYEHKTKQFLKWRTRYRESIL
uniref:Putative ovule protein n=1 Tax=Solanum chacoense TaxID=4108 RepID=A0A0V0GFS7_SOLCH